MRYSYPERVCACENPGVEGLHSVCPSRKKCLIVTWVSLYNAYTDDDPGMITAEINIEGFRFMLIYKD